MTRLPDLEIRQIATETLVPYARNARKHSKRQIDQLAESIDRFGFNNPILVDGAAGVIAGHGRLIAAQRLGLAQVPVIELGHLDEAQKRAFILADNKLAEGSSWDQDLLDLEVADLASLESVADIPGFSVGELDRIRSRSAGASDTEDDAPALAAFTVTEPGDVWQLGPHRLICGDATNPDVVASVLAGASPHLMVTDPPYGVSYDPDWRNRVGVGYAPDRATGTVQNDGEANWRLAWHNFGGDVAYVWHSSLHSAEVWASLVEEKFSIRAQIIWAKTTHQISRGHYHWQHEPCFYAVRGTAHWQGSRVEKTLWTIEHRKSETGHGTQKPVECMRRPILNNSAPGEAVYDPFLGSGTTLIAAESEGRICYGVEIDPAYVDVAVRRWQATGAGEAMLESTGDTFDDTAAAPESAAA